MNEIVNFIENVLNLSKTDSLTPSQRDLIIEFYTRYMFLDQEHQTMSDNDALKYLTMGWYVYSNMSQNKYNLSNDLHNDQPE